MEFKCQFLLCVFWHRHFPHGPPSATCLTQPCCAALCCTASWQLRSAPPQPRRGQWLGSGNMSCAAKAQGFIKSCTTHYPSDKCRARTAADMLHIKDCADSVSRAECCSRRASVQSGPVWEWPDRAGWRGCQLLQPAGRQWCGGVVVVAAGISTLVPGRSPDVSEALWCCGASHTTWWGGGCRLPGTTHHTSSIMSHHSSQQPPSGGSGCCVCHAFDSRCSGGVEEKEVKLEHSNKKSHTTMEGMSSVLPGSSQDSADLTSPEARLR
ncbi:hypothetical protein E2C01_004119 [Portunus trituberculatus]|uniref:Uncharacterized protein n=1 Tax=Portunus trituberculatus TaxID=210409 RepID=A0A5B7CP24_PORTR|nr:hypothetical protein [Portunus trituberculatus]